MATAIVSDLHLGSAHGEDLLRDPEIRAVLLERLAGAERLILLGDTLELRELPLPIVLAGAQRFFEDLGEAMAGREVVLVPGNHDHRLAEPILDAAAVAGSALELEQVTAPTSRPTETIAAWLGPARLRVAYPGIWLRPDVYATHGHYMDCHMGLPRIECIAAAAAMRAFGPPPTPAAPDDYERVLRPVYGLSYGLAQGGLARRASRPSERALKAIAGRGNGSRARRTALAAAVRAGIPAAVWSLNRALGAEFDADLSSASNSQSGIDAATELVARLRLEGVDVITGHTHRGGPWPEEAEWPLAGGGRLHNSGCWVFASAFHHPGTPPGPYWPGTLTWLDESGPPRRERLLLDRSGEQLGATVVRLAA